jgi:hypothetical protein
LYGIAARFRAEGDGVGGDHQIAVEMTGDFEHGRVFSRGGPHDHPRDRRQAG